MGIPQTPQEAAPAYDDVFSDHPVNGYKPSSSTSAYAAVPQNDDVELGESHQHNHTSESTPCATSTTPETFAQTVAGVFRPKPHVHCETCDRQQAERDRREHSKHACNMVATTFMVAFICATMFGIIATIHINAKRRRDHHG